MEEQARSSRWLAVGAALVAGVGLAVACQEAVIDALADESDIGFDPYGITLLFLFLAAPAVQLWAGARRRGREVFAALAVAAILTVLSAAWVAENVAWSISVAQAVLAGVVGGAQALIARRSWRVGRWTLAQGLLATLAVAIVVAWGMDTWNHVDSGYLSLVTGLLRLGFVVCLAAACFAVAAAAARWLAPRRAGGRARGWVVTVAGGALAIMIAAGFSSWALRSRPVSWRLVGVGPGSRSVEVRATQGDFNGCLRDLRARLVSRDARQLRIEVRGRPIPDCDVGGFDSASLLVGLASPLHGEAIVGEKRRSVAMEVSYVERTHPHRGYRAMPRLIGLAPADALALLGHGLHRAGVVTVTRGARGRVVVAQDPAPGAALPPAFTTELPTWSRAAIHLATD